MTMRRGKFVSKRAGTDDAVILELNDETFGCNSKIPGMVLVDFVSGMDEDDPQAMGKILGDLIKAALKPGEYERFMAYTRDPVNEVDLDVLAEICGWLAEQYTGDPTQPSQPSSDGSSPSGASSSEPAYAAAMTSGASAPTS